MSAAQAEHRANEVIGLGRVWAAETLATPTFLGLVTLGPNRSGDSELSYSFVHQHWGHGYAREATTLAIDWGFDQLGLTRIVATTQSANARSRRLLESLGMTAGDEFMEFEAVQKTYHLDAAAWRSTGPLTAP
jgi:RimJ/RimL family protein N-acetyltransferase